MPILLAYFRRSHKGQAVPFGQAGAKSCIWLPVEAGLTNENTRIPYEYIFRDYQKIRELFIILKKVYNFKLTIASFGLLHIIKELVNTVYIDLEGNPLFDLILTTDNYYSEAIELNMKNIPISNNRLIMDTNCGGGFTNKEYSKNFMIKIIMEKFNIRNPKNILLLDDDENNIMCAKYMTNVNTVHVNFDRNITEYISEGTLDHKILVDSLKKFFNLRFDNNNNNLFIDPNTEINNPNIQQIKITSENYVGGSIYLQKYLKYKHKYINTKYNHKYQI